MPKDDYASAIGGGLKLKGSKPEGVKKKKKKDKSKISSDLASTSTKDPEASKDLEGKETKVSEDVDAEELGRLEEEAYGGSGGGKTEAEKKYDEMKRKRVCIFLLSDSHFSLGSNSLSSLDI
jgi:protein FAM32A